MWFHCEGRLCITTANIWTMIVPPIARTAGRDETFLHSCYGPDSAGRQSTSPAAVTILAPQSQDGRRAAYMSRRTIVERRARFFVLLPAFRPGSLKCRTPTGTTSAAQQYFGC